MTTKLELKPPTANALLAGLTRPSFKRLQASLEPVQLDFGEILYEPRHTIKYVYFPINSLVSLLTVVDRRLPLEVGMVGNEGMVGIPLALGVDVSPVRALVQGMGTALRMNAAFFRREIRNNVSLQTEVNRYTHALMIQVSQTAACNRFHTVDARLARWLLMTRDRVGSNQFRLTHEFLAHMLGVRREGVSSAANDLKRRKLIEYSRGEISIMNSRGLEAQSCSCYASVKQLNVKA